MPETAPAGAPVLCCPQRDLSSVGACSLCDKPICKNCRSTANDKPVCPACRDKIAAELRAEAADRSALARAVAGGLAASVLGGAAWALMVVLTNHEIGYAAVGVGYLSAYGVHLASGKKKGKELQWLAVLCAILGLAFGKYFGVVHAIKLAIPKAQELSYFSPRFVPIFITLFPQVVNIFDLLWLFLALSVAWRVLKPTQIRLT